MKAEKISVSEYVYQYLKGGYDLHIHTKPSHFPRLLDDFAVTEQAAKAGMAGVMLKSHYEPTGARAALVNERLSLPHTKAFGGVVLNHPVGGLNPYAVESALKMGASFVWMPTRDAANSLTSGNMPGDFFSRPGISILDEKGHLLPVVEEILRLVKKYDGVLATGHISPEEANLLCQAGCALGVKMVLTHPEFDRTMVPPSLQQELAALGTWVEKCWYNIAAGTVTPEEMAAHIRTVGAEHCFLTTDRGQVGLETPVEGMAQFAAALLERGITPLELEIMLQRNPKELVGS